ncbi:MAG: hypothetical protein D6824_00010 [Planctomycetota bacterium]|nr:MAG: hypothetical protein D6824_00010 [Planctomycetota bacterium]
MALLALAAALLTGAAEGQTQRFGARAASATATATATQRQLQLSRILIPRKLRLIVPYKRRRIV